MPAVQETGVWSLAQEGPLEKGVAAHSSLLAWRIPWMEEPGGLQSMRSLRVGHDLATERQQQQQFLLRLLQFYYSPRKSTREYAVLCELQTVSLKLSRLRVPESHPSPSFYTRCPASLACAHVNLRIPPG